MKRKLALFGVLLIAAQAHASDAQAPGPQVLGPDDVATARTPAVTVVPAYPVDLRRRGVSGCVTLSYVIEPDGRVSQVQMLDGRASPRSPVAERLALEQFAGAGAAALEAMRFTPNGQPRSTLTATTLHFGEPVASAGCDGTQMARRLQQNRDWETLLARNAFGGRRLAYAGDEAGGGAVVRAMDSPWDGTTQLILSAPTEVAGGR